MINTQNIATPLTKEIISVDASKPDIRKRDIEALKTYLTEIGEKSFRAKQIYEWLWNKSVHSFDQMTNLSLATRDRLNADFTINGAALDHQQISADKTIKSTFRLFDNNVVEGVLIPTENRMTACVSSQVGCSLSCKFCATGYMKRMRNLEAAEIYDQVVHIRQQAEQHYQIPLSNIVFMGMGEPLLNYANVMQAIDYITSPSGLGMAPRRITVSTAGIAKMIKKLGDDQVKFKLALSLHAANDEKRSKIMPINDANSLPVLAEALQYYYKKTRNRITFEYIVFNDFNDSLEDAEELFKFTQKVPSKVNIIEYNPISEADFINTGEDKLLAFSNYLIEREVNVNIRRSRGKDIDAACGQLANKQ